MLSSEKWPISGLQEGRYKMSVEHHVLPENKEVFFFFKKGAFHKELA